MPLVNCKTCGKEFHVKPSALKRGRGDYCSRHCYGKTLTGERNPRFKSAEVVCTCRQCFKKFSVFLSAALTGYGRYCSMSCRNKAEHSGEKHYAWNGGKSTTPEGYVKVTVPRRKGMYEHTMIAEHVLGRRLGKKEVVHHINGNKSDNRNCNLLICENGYHHWLHQRMAKLYQQEHFGHI